MVLEKEDLLELADTLESTSEKLQEKYSWAKDDDERRRTFIFKQLKDQDIDIDSLLTKMIKIEKWLKEGSISETKPLKFKDYAQFNRD